MTSPLESSPRRLKNVSRCADNATSPTDPGNAVPGMWPIPRRNVRLSAPSMNTADKSIEGISKTPNRLKAFRYSGIRRPDQHRSLQRFGEFPVQISLTYPPFGGCAGVNGNGNNGHAPQHIFQPAQHNRTPLTFGSIRDRMPLPPIAQCNETNQRERRCGLRKGYGFRLSRRYRFWFCRRSYSLCRRLNLERRLGYRFFHSRFRRRLLPEYRRWFRQFRHNRRRFRSEFHRQLLWVAEFHSAEMSGIEPLMKRGNLPFSAHRK